MKKIFAALFSGFFAVGSFSQNPINAFANVTAISGTSLSVNNVNETFHSFEDGEYVIIMQMQDAVIGTNTTNASTFGDIAAIGSAGQFEVARILSHTESASLPTSITLSTALANTYTVHANASVQLITFRALGANYTSTASIGTFTWNGIIGGVTAMSVTNVFTLAHSISADGAGFTGGGKNTPIGYTACDNTTYATAIATRYAGKGDGIYKRTNAALAGGRGKIANGGGGGNDVNAGGGGGGNYSAGGGGGSGWVSAGTGCSPGVGGLGGVSLSPYISGSRVFMGGGGGGGHENDNNGTIGTRGGGIILIRTGTLITTSCSGISISANGVGAANATNDGAGGGGAGGSILFSVNTFSVSGACTLTISANGGNGGNSNASSAGAHGGGGGGGQGVIIYSSAQPTANVTTNTTPGSGGVSCSGCSSSLNGSVGTGTTNAGVVASTPVSLPVELLSFNASVTKNKEVELNWTTAVEKNSDRFILERMSSGTHPEDLVEIKCKGNYSSYNYVDTEPENGINYYRLKQVDNDGRIFYKDWIDVNVNNGRVDILMYPNPLKSNEGLMFECRGMKPSDCKVEVFDIGSQLLLDKTISDPGEKFSLPISNISTGLYVVKVTVDNRVFYKKLVISN
jgi:hypothetical protein